jgi:hypothetical protein
MPPGSGHAAMHGFSSQGGQTIGKKTLRGSSFITRMRERAGLTTRSCSSEQKTSHASQPVHLSGFTLRIIGPFQS